MQTDQGFELIDINDKEADFDIEKWLNGNFRLANDYIKEIKASRLESTIEPLTFYVDATNGNDINDGASVETALKTLTKARDLASIAKYVYHNIKIRVMAGDYSTEGLIESLGFMGSSSYIITAFDGTNDVTSNATASNYKVYGIKFSNCSARCYAQGFEGTATDSQPFIAYASPLVFFTGCETLTPAAYAGFVYTSGASGRIYNCVASNRLQAALVDLNSSVQSREWGVCTGNTYGIYCISSTVYKYGTQPQATNLEVTTNGGQILGETTNKLNVDYAYQVKAFYRNMLTPTGQNEVEIDLGVGSFAGTLRITVASGYSNANAVGTVTKEIDFTGAASLAYQASKYIQASPNTKAYFMISDIYIKNGRKTIKVVQLLNKNAVNIILQAFGTFTYFDAITCGESVASTETFVVPSTSPTKNRIATGFYSGWSGAIDWRVDSNNKKSYRMTLLNSVDIVAGLTTVYTPLPPEARPSEDLMITINLMGSGQNSIANSYANIIIEAATGKVIVYPVLGTTLTGARMVYGAILSEY